MSKRNKKFITQELFSALSASSKTGKTTQVAFDLSANGRMKLKIDAAMDDITPAEKAREALGLSVKTKKTRDKLVLRLSEEDFIYLALKYGIDPEDKLSIRNKAADDIAEKYSEDEVEFQSSNQSNVQWPDS